jgi:surface carbohydrate biosynthesis protein
MFIDSSKTIYIPIETKVRELDSKILISYQALHEGFNIVLGSISGVVKVAEKVGKGVFFFKDNSFIQFNNLLNKDLIFAVHDVEGVVFDSVDSLIDRYLNPGGYPGGLERSDIQFISGVIQKNILNDYKSNLFLVGEPRFDLHREVFYPFFRNYNKSPKQDYILITTNFAYVNNEWINYDKLSRDITAELVIKSYSSLIETLAKNFINYLIVIRPHPSENLAYWTKLSVQHKNVIINHSDNVINVIKNAKAVVFSDSTSGLESILLKVNSIRFDPRLDSSGNSYCITRNVGYYCQTVTEVISALDKILNFGQSLISYEYEMSKIQKFACNVSEVEELSSKKIVSVLRKFVLNNTEAKMVSIQDLKVKEKWIVRFKLFIWGSSYVLDNLFYLYFKIRPLNFISKRKQKFPFLIRKEITSRIKFFHLVFSKGYDNLNVVKISTDTFLISRKT